MAVHLGIMAGKPLCASFPLLYITQSQNEARSTPDCSTRSQPFVLVERLILAGKLVNLIG